MSSAGLLGEQRQVVGFSVQEEMALSSVQIRVDVASFCIRLFWWILIAVYGCRRHISMLHNLGPFNTATYQFIRMF